jgi:hypothetical protein
MKYEPGRLADHRWNADPDRVAIILPGGGYTPARPLLHFARAILFRHGWTVQELWWTVPSLRDAAERAAWVATQVSAAVQAESAGTVMLVGKSLGSFAAPVAAARSLPAIWLTPLLVDPFIVTALKAASAPTLLIGASQDRLWDRAVADLLGLPTLEIEGADHGMETDADPVRSAEILCQVTSRMDTFLTELAASGG